MASSKRNKQLYIDAEALSTLALVQEGLISPVNKLMTESEAIELRETKMYKGVPFPFPFLLTPKGKRNEECIVNLKKGEVVDLINDNNHVGRLTVDETFIVEVDERLKCIYGTSDKSHPGVQNTIKRIGRIAISGEYEVKYPLIAGTKRMVQRKIEEQHATKISSLVLSASPLNRAHERMIRQAIEHSDLVVLFLLKPFNTSGLRYDIRYNAMMTFIENFIPQNKVIVVPLENSYIFAGYNELILDALVAKNYGCTHLIVGNHHAGLGLFYDQDRLNSIFDVADNMQIKVKTAEQYVYCNKCRTLVSPRTCPHGQHHHIHYHSPSILQLIHAGMMPPSILVRREVSASILSTLFPDRFERLQELYDALVPNEGLIEEHSEEDFYIKLMGLYQTSSLT